MATRPGQVLPGFWAGRARARGALGLLSPPDFRQPLSSGDQGTSAVWRDWLFTLDSGEPPAPITGTLARTNADDTLAATAVEAFTGTLAATNGGGGGGASGPADFTAEYDPDDVAGTVLTGADVDELIDLSSNSYDLNVSAGATPVTIEAGTQGRDVLDFTGGNNGPELATGTAPTGVLTAAAWSVVVEIAPNANPTETEATTNPDEANAVFGFIGSNASQYVAVRYNTGTSQIEGGGGGFGPGYSNGMEWTPIGAVDEWGTLSVTYDGTDLVVRWNNDAPVTRTVALLSLGTLNTMQIGRGGGVLATYNGKVGRARVFDYALSQAEVDDTVDEWSGAGGGGAGDTLAATGTGDGIGGSLATTNGADTLAASGTPTVAGTLARTNADDTLAASGDATASNDVAGTLAATNANDTLAATAVETFSGSLARTNANDTSAASGTPTVAGTLARTNADDTSAGTAATGVAGTLARSNGADTLAATAAETFSGSLARSNGADTLAATAAVAYTGTLARTNANDTSVASGTPTVAGTAASTNANDTSAAAGTFGDVVDGTLARTNANDTLAATGTALLAVTGTLARSNGADTLSSGGTPIVSGETGTRATHSADFDEFWTGVDWIGGWFTYTDAAGLSVTFEFEDGGGVTPGNTSILIDSADDAPTVAEATRAAISASGLAVDVGELVYLDLDFTYSFAVTQRLSGTRGNTAVDTSEPFFLGADTFYGGTNLEVANDTATASGSGGSTVTGTLARSNGNDALAAVAAIAYSGTAAATNANDTLAASGTPTVAGTAASTNANDTASATGVFGDSVSGSLARSNAADTSAAEALTSYLASGGSVNANDEAAAQTLVAVIAAGAAANTNDAASMAGAQTFLAALARANLADTLAAAGLVLDPVTGSLGRTNADDTLAGTGAMTAATVGAADAQALARSWADSATSTEPPTKVLVARVLPRSWADAATSTEPPTKVLVARAGTRSFSDSA